MAPSNTALEKVEAAACGPAPERARNDRRSGDSAASSLGIKSVCVLNDCNLLAGRMSSSLFVQQQTTEMAGQLFSCSQRARRARQPSSCSSASEIDDDQRERETLGAVPSACESPPHDLCILHSGACKINLSRYLSLPRLMITFRLTRGLMSTF